VTAGGSETARCMASVEGYERWLLRPGGLPPPAVQVTAQQTQSRTRALGEHTGRAHTDHDLAAGWTMAGNLDPTPGEADVNALSPRGLIPGYAQNLWIGA
jgi:hypothetical protein